MSYGPTNGQVVVLCLMVALTGYAILRGAEAGVRWVSSHVTVTWNEVDR